MVVSGTIGLLIAGKLRGVLESVTPWLDSPGAAGFRMSDSLYLAARCLADE